MRLARLIPIAAAVAIHAGPSQALVVEGFLHSVQSEFVHASGVTLASNTRTEAFPPSGVFVESLSAPIGGGGFAAAVGMLPSGIYGLDGELSTTGTLTTGVTIIEDVTNDSVAPIDVSMSFIITGGDMFLVAGEDSSLSFALTVGEFAKAPIFEATGAMTGTPTFGATFATSGDSIGATFDGIGTVDIPFSVHTVTFPTIAPGDTLTIRYDFEMRAVGGIVEVITFAFRDPPAAGVTQATTYVTAAAGPTVLFGPPTLLLLLGGLLSLTALRITPPPPTRSRPTTA